MPAGLRQEPGGTFLHCAVAGDATSLRPRRGRARPRDGADRPRIFARNRRTRLPAARRRRACPVSQTFADACERQSVMTTTSMEFFRWGSVFGDDRMAAAVVDRIVHHGMLAQFKGESYRVRHALMWGRVLKNGAQIPCASCSKVIVHSAQNYLTKHVPRPVQGRVDQAPAELPRVVLLGAPGRWLGRRWGRGPTGRAGWALAPSVSVPSGARDVVGGLKKPSAKSRAHGHCAVVVALCETGCCGC